MAGRVVRFMEGRGFVYLAFFAIGFSIATIPFYPLIGFLTLFLWLINLFLSRGQV